MLIIYLFLFTNFFRFIFVLFLFYFLLFIIISLFSITFLSSFFILLPLLPFLYRLLCKLYQNHIKLSDLLQSQLLKWQLLPFQNIYLNKLNHIIPNFFLSLNIRYSSQLRLRLRKQYIQSIDDYRRL